MWNDVWNCITSSDDTHEERVESMLNCTDLNADEAEELVNIIEDCMK